MCIAEILALSPFTQLAGSFKRFYSASWNLSKVTVEIIRIEAGVAEKVDKAESECTRR